MTSRQVGRVNGQSKGETPLMSGVLQRAAVRAVADKEGEGTQEVESGGLSQSRFVHDFSQLPIDRGDLPIIQPKLMIGAAGDRYEQEADRVARDVVSRMNAPVSSMVQREEISEVEEEELQKKPIVQRVSDVGGMAASPELEGSIQGARGSGQPLSFSVREPIEREFGADFSGVRVHTDAQSDELNRSIQAKAFTTGQDIFFRQGTYVPGSREGQELLVHELTHVVQQSGAVQRESKKKLSRKPIHELRQEEVQGKESPKSVWGGNIGTTKEVQIKKENKTSSIQRESTQHLLIQRELVDVVLNTPDNGIRWKKETKYTHLKFPRSNNMALEVYVNSKDGMYYYINSAGKAIETGIKHGEEPKEKQEKGVYDDLAPSDIKEDNKHDSSKRETNINLDSIVFAQKPKDSKDDIEKYKSSYARDKEKVEKAVHVRLQKLLSEERKTIAKRGEKEYRTHLEKGFGVSEGKVRRALDRLAWIIAHLKDARECVAVNLTNDKLFVWANKTDEYIKRDTNNLLKAAKAYLEEAKEELDATINDLWASLEKSKLDLRTEKPTNELWHKAERRLRKTVKFLAQLQNKMGFLEAEAIQPKYVEAGKKGKTIAADQKLHAEQRAAEAYLRQKVEADLNTIKGTFGISKLCCFHCWLSLQALATTMQVEINTTGTHFNTYGNWPPPPFLEQNDKILMEFLGIRRKEDLKKEDELLQKYVKEYKAEVLYAIQSFNSSEGMGMNTTDYVSSEDEAEDDLINIMYPLKKDEKPPEPKRRKLLESEKGKVHEQAEKNMGGDILDVMEEDLTNISSQLQEHQEEIQEINEENDKEKEEERIKKLEELDEEEEFNDDSNDSSYEEKSQSSKKNNKKIQPRKSRKRKRRDE